MFGLYKKSKLPKELLYLDIDNLFLLPAGELVIDIVEPKNIYIVNLILRNPARILAVLPLKNKKLISNVGCAAKITSFTEQANGDYKITLSAICRFYINDVKVNLKSIGRVVPTWQGFADDLNLSSQKISNRNDLNHMVFDYLNICQERDNIDFDKIEQISDSKIISLLVDKLECNNDDKAELIRARNLNDFSLIFHDIMALQVATYESKINIKH